MAIIEDKISAVAGKTINDLKPGDIFQILRDGCLITAIKVKVSDNIAKSMDIGFTCINLETGDGHGFGESSPVLYWPQATIMTMGALAKDTKLEKPFTKPDKFGKLTPGAIYRHVDASTREMCTCIKIAEFRHGDTLAEVNLDSGLIQFFHPENPVDYLPQACIQLSPPRP